MKNGAVKRVGSWTNRRYINRLLLLFWIFVFAALICACNPPAYAVAGQKRLTGKADGAMSDADVFAMLADLHGNAEGARDASSDGNHRAVMFARAEDGAAERSKSESLEKLRRAETIRISGREIPEGGNLREYKRNALEYGKSLRGSYVNKDTGREISLGRSGITEILRHDYKDAEHLQSIAAIPQIIENAVYIDTLPNEDLAKNGDIQGYEYYVSGLNVGGADYTVRAVVAVSRNGNRYYDHKLTKIEKGNLLSLLDRVSTTGASESKSPLSGIDDKRLLQILQDKDAGKGGIADFDTEAVRFSRAANIGAAISHITGKKIRFEKRAERPLGCFEGDSASVFGQAADRGHLRRRFGRPEGIRAFVGTLRRGCEQGGYGGGQGCQGMGQVEEGGCESVCGSDARCDAGEG